MRQPADGTRVLFMAWDVDSLSSVWLINSVFSTAEDMDGLLLRESASRTILAIIGTSNVSLYVTSISFQRL